MENKIFKICVCVCVYNNHFAVEQKLTVEINHTSIFEKRINNIKH